MVDAEKPWSAGKDTLAVVPKVLVANLGAVLEAVHKGYTTSTAVANWSEDETF